MPALAGAQGNRTAARRRILAFAGMKAVPDNAEMELRQRESPAALRLGAKLAISVEVWRRSDIGGGGMARRKSPLGTALGE